MYRYDTIDQQLIDERVAQYRDQIARNRAGTLSDAASKPIFIAGPDGWRDMARRLAVGLVLRVDADGRIFASEALHKRLEYLGKAPEIVVVQ